MKIALNVWAFLFGPFYYLAKGMFRKAFTLTLFCFVMIILIDIVITLFGLKGLSTASNFVAAAVFGTRANVDFYKKIVLNRNGWI